MNKKLVAIMCAALMGCCTMGNVVPQTPLRAKAKTTLHFVGDVNLDNEVTSTDASLILNLYANLSAGQKTTDINFVLADYNHDGEISSTDASAVLKFYAGVATGMEPKYEIVATDDTPNVPETPVDDGSLFNECDYVQYRKSEVKVYTSPEENPNYLYKEKAVLTNGDKFIIVSIKENDWYQIAFLETPEIELFIKIAESSEFSKIGEVEIRTTTTATDNATTTTESTVTSTETTSVETTSIVDRETTETVIESATTTTATETMTESVTTTTATETSNESTTTTVSKTTTETATTTTMVLDNEFSIGSIFEFTVENGSYYIHNSTSNSSSGDLYPYKNTLKQGDKFVIIEKEGYWYKVKIPNVVDEVYLFINEYEQKYFEKVGYEDITSVTTTTTTEPTTTSTTSTSTTTTTSVESTTTTTTTTEVVTTTATTTFDSEVKIGSVMSFSLEGGSWFIHESITEELDGNLYEEKPYLVYGDEFQIIEISNSWYAVKINNMQKVLYLRIPANELTKYFRKVGQSAIVEPTISTVTTATTADTTSTEPATTTESITASCIVCKFVGDSWNIRSTPGIGDNVVGYLSKNDIFYVKEVTEGNWARIFLNNVGENFYVQIDDVNFQRVYGTCINQFNGIEWNIRSSMKFSTENIVACLYNGDVFLIEDTVVIDGIQWYKILTNKVKDVATYVAML